MNSAQKWIFLHPLVASGESLYYLTFFYLNSKKHALPIIKRKRFGDNSPGSEEFVNDRPRVQMPFADLYVVCNTST